jgi:hypothetical protein
VDGGRRYLTDMEGSKQAAATLAHCVDQMKRIALHTTEAVREVRVIAGIRVALVREKAVRA